MARPNGPTVLLLMTLCVLSEQQDKVTLEVHYHKGTITPTKGSSVRLSCDAYYDFDACGLLQVRWYRISDLNVELTDPRKYLTTVNETVSLHNVRRRQVVTEILDLTEKDDGEFQCKADCEKGETAMGHYIGISVQG